MRKKLLALFLAAAMALSVPAIAMSALQITATEAQADTPGSWTSSNGGWYYYNNGSMVTGWIYYKSNWYFLDLNTGLMKSNEWFTDQNGYLYYAKSWGGIYINTSASINGRGYTFDSAGRISGTAWVQKDGNWYLIVDRKPATGWHLVDNNWYYMNSDGTMKANEKFYHSGHWYFVNSWGGMRHSGWYKENGEWYYLYSWGGTYNSGQANINGKTYYFYSDSGIMAHDTEIDGNYYTSSGAMKKSGTQATELLGLSEREVVELIGPRFTEDEKQCGILACVSMAQFILESGYGHTELAQNANNCFGMKANLAGNTWEGSTWDGVSIYSKSSPEADANGNYTYPVSDFRIYDCLEDCFADHAAFLCNSKKSGQPRYPGINTIRDYKEVCRLLQSCGYATSPTYADKLIEIIERWNLTRFNA